MKRLILISALLIFLAGCGSNVDSVSSHDGVPIAFEKSGAGETTLVLVHGWSCDQTYWREQVPFLAENFTVVTVDLAGHGQSGQGRQDYTMQAFGADVAAVVSALDLKNVYLVGHSMGGSVVVEAAGLLPERVVGIIGVDTLQEMHWDIAPEQVDGYLVPFGADFPGTAKKFVSSMFPAGADTAVVNWVSNDMSSAPQEIAISAMKNLFTHDLRPTLATLTVPLWCLNANQMPVDFQGWEAYQPGYTAVLMEGVGHFLFLERPGEFNTKLVDMIGRMGD
ncbi:MAG: alpha/beta hydrolase [bacterium]|nr:alpha/beta hydrolase [bacterium]